MRHHLINGWLWVNEAVLNSCRVAFVGKHNGRQRSFMKCFSLTEGKIAEIETITRKDHLQDKLQNLLIKNATITQGKKDYTYVEPCRNCT